MIAEQKKIAQLTSAVLEDENSGDEKNAKRNNSLAVSIFAGSEVDEQE